ncbi:MAG: hypothetical protein GF387_00465 [Candidatus Portnoybacteria bacterium]|nr:hypothetical protein [Candidatus Portnoybacteria bacterium]
MKNLIIHTKTKQDWIDVMKSLLDAGYAWGDGDREICEELWDVYEENSCIDVGVGDPENRIGYFEKEWHQENHPHIPIITADEFLNKTNQANEQSYTLSIQKDYNEPDAKKMNKLTAKVIRDFNKNEKELYKSNFKDENKNWTRDAWEQTQEMLMDEKYDQLLELAKEINKEQKAN